MQSDIHPLRLYILDKRRTVLHAYITTRYIVVCFICNSNNAVGILLHLTIIEIAYLPGIARHQIFH